MYTCNAFCWCRQPRGRSPTCSLQCSVWLKCGNLCRFCAFYLACQVVLYQRSCVLTTPRHQRHSFSARLVFSGYFFGKCAKPTVKPCISRIGPMTGEASGRPSSMGPAHGFRVSLLKGKRNLGGRWSSKVFQAGGFFWHHLSKKTLRLILCFLACVWKTTRKHHRCYLPKEFLAILQSEFYYCYSKKVNRPFNRPFFCRQLPTHGLNLTVL